MKYLITDDSSLARKMTQKVLKKFIEEDDEIFLAKNGQEAIEIYKNEKPDLCFMDLTMPVLDGFEATKQIVEFDEKARIIVITADIQQHAIDKVLEDGAIEFIPKPIDEKKMFKTLHKYGIL